MTRNAIWLQLIGGGGVTLRACDNTAVTHGKVVGKLPGTFIVLRHAGPADVMAALEMAARRSPYVGAWYDVRTETVHVDPVDVVNAPEEAERLAVLRGQEAWYDLDTRTEHRVPS